MRLYFKNGSVAFVQYDIESSAPNTRTSQVRVGFSRVPTPFYSKRKAITAAAVIIGLWLGYVALKATDVPDTKPTVEVGR